MSSAEGGGWGVWSGGGEGGRVEWREGGGTCGVEEEGGGACGVEE